MIGQARAGAGVDLPGAPLRPGRAVTRAAVAPVRLMGVGLAMGVLAGCATAAAPPPVRLSVAQVAYDCATRVLTVEGGTSPAVDGLRIQVQVRTAPERRGVVWTRTVSGPDGRWRASGRDPLVSAALAQGPITLVVRAGAVTQGVRVFSPRTQHPVSCTPTP